MVGVKTGRVNTELRQLDVISFYILVEQCVLQCHLHYSNRMVWPTVLLVSKDEDGYSVVLQELLRM